MTTTESCATCACRSAEQLAPTTRLVVASRLAHTLQALRAIASDSGLHVEASSPGTIEILGNELAPLLATVGSSLSTSELGEARAVFVDADSRFGDPRRALALALAAPTLGQLSARSLESTLAAMLEREADHFYSVYQPIVELASGDVVGHEALLRGVGANGPVMPDDLFAAADAAGWLHVLDRVGRTTALRHAARWLGGDQLFVNFIPTTIYRPEVCLKTTERAAKEAGVDLEQVVFEITESEQVRDVKHLQRIFDYYRARGCRIALDDLGSGYNSLNLLIELRPDVVKIDRATVAQLPGPTATTLVRAIVDIAASSNTVVLAEGVETAEQAEAARALGVTLGQGWHFGRPVLRGDAARAIAERRDAPRPSCSPYAQHGIDPAILVERN